ncbi:MAG: hypothetical protein K2J17_05390 [Paramuribaculum sp.]|nr:hypothetical protein [Paramuribaculum sp.]
MFIRDSFNIIGSVCCLALCYQFTDLILWITERIGTGNPNGLYDFITNLQQTDPEVYNHLFDSKPTGTEDLDLRISAVKPAIAQLQFYSSIGLCVFYTSYKLVNLGIMIWFTNVYVKVVEWIIPSKKKEDDEFQLNYISGGILSTAELSITQAEKEIAVYAERVSRMLDMAKELVHSKDGSDEFTKLYSRLEKYEDISDRMEIEIADYLKRSSEGRLSNASKRKLTAMLRIISEVESIADCCLGVGKILQRKQQSGVKFNEEIYDNIDLMFDDVKLAMDNMLLILKHLESPSEAEIMASYNAEREINNRRNSQRNANIENINAQHYEYQAGIYYMDIISDLEKTGDYIINVVDAVRDQIRHASAMSR